MNLAIVFATAVEKHGPKPLIFWGEEQFNYHQVGSRAEWVSSELKKIGVRPGDRVGIWLKNCPEYVSVLFGVFLSGAVAVPINNFLKSDEVAFILGDSETSVLVTEPSTAEQFDKLCHERPGLKAIQISNIPAMIDPSLVPQPERSPGENDLAVIIYTSGTTGRPKGAMLSHGNLLHNVESCRIMLSAISHDRFVVLLPMFHSFMLTVGMLLPTLVGGSLIIIKSLNPPKNIIHEIIQHRGTILPSIPQFFRTFANATLPPNLPLRLCISGAAPLPREILAEFNRKLPDLPLIEGYGLSEASPVVSLNPVQGPWKAGSIGVPIANVEVSVQDDAGKMLSTGEIGEICVRGGNVMLGYWKQPEATAQTLRRGWLLTGDIGYRDADGYYYITDRKKDMLLVNGINVYPREVEEVIYQFPGVREAAVIGCPDTRKGEHPVAYVVPNEGIQLETKALLAFIRDRLADYKAPRQIHLLQSLPRNATGKVLKTKLREMASCPPPE
ncbi:MAG: long-chain fatty acid--CoA ligase [Verrucomicrobiota bacterium]|nr:long-chain fatty acid--CoA ligase [Verrucomicrobiota bacterium]